MDMFAKINSTARTSVALWFFVAIITKTNGMRVKNSISVPSKNFPVVGKIKLISNPLIPTSGYSIVAVSIVIKTRIIIQIRSVISFPIIYSILDTGSGIIDFSVRVSMSMVNK